MPIIAIKNALKNEKIFSKIRAKFFIKLFMCVFYLMDYIYSRYKLKHNSVIKEIISGKKQKNQKKL